MDFNTLLSSFGLTLAGIFSLGFFAGLVFWVVMRGIIPKILFLLIIMSVFGLSLPQIKSYIESGTSDITHTVQQYVKDNIKK